MEVIVWCGGEGKSVGQAIYECYDVRNNVPDSFGAGKLSSVLSVKIAII